MKMTFVKTLIAGAIAIVSSNVFAYGEPPSTSWILQSNASTANVKIYKLNGSETYVQVVDMLAGARVSMHQTYMQDIQSPNNQKYYPAYKRDLVSTWYSNLGSPVSVINGDYFNNNQNPNAWLSFPIRANGYIVDKGTDPKNDRQIEFSAGRGAYVTAYDPNRFLVGASSGAQNMIGGFSPSLSDKPTTNMGRTGFCTLNPSSPSGKFLIFSAKSATQSVVNSYFSSWKCNQGSEIMMDGSSSAQMSAYGIQMQGEDTFWRTGRTVPQVIAVWNR